MIIVFYDIFVKLCRNNNISPNKACIDMGLSRSVAAKWKHTNTYPSAETLAKIAKYFEVTVDYLLNDSIEKLPQPNSFPKKFRAISRLEESELTPEEDEKIVEYLEFLLHQRNRNGGKEE